MSIGVMTSVICFTSSFATGFSTTQLANAPARRQRPRPGHWISASALSSRPRLLWIEAESKSSLTAGLEAGVGTFLFRNKAPLLEECSRIAKFNSVTIGHEGVFNTKLVESGADIQGVLKVCCDAKDVEALIDRAAKSRPDEVYIMDTATGWRIIPVENFIAAKQQAGFDARFMVVSETAAEAEQMLSLLDVGVDGVVLRSEDPCEISRFGQLRAGLDDERQAQEVGSARFATVLEVRGAGFGDRVCVDCCCIMAPDEMLLVGNSSGTLFGVLSEAVESDYVESRPFRFNAGPVHAYCLCPNGRTQYLSELKSGDEVVVVRTGDDGGLDARTAVVGRCKVERRPLVLITVATGDGQTASLFMQNAETCRVAIESKAGVSEGCSVIGLKPGNRVLLRQDGSARHRGFAIEEYLVEK